MRYYVDTEFNGNGGQLLSVGIVSQHDDRFYAELHVHEILQPWVAEHVMTRMQGVPVSRAECTAALRNYLRKDRGTHTFVCDWPEDLAHLGNLLVSGQGLRISPTCFRILLLDLPGFSTAESSAKPHHALEDAVALRDYVERGITDGPTGALTPKDFALLQAT